MHVIKIIITALFLLITSSISFAADASINPKYKITEKERTCLYLNAFFEGATDTIAAHQGFIEVVANRRISEDYPNDMCRVIYDDSAFSWTIRKRPVHNNEKYIMALIQITVDGIIDGLQRGAIREITFTADHYHADYVTPCWIKDMKLTNVLGAHKFYKQVKRTGACG